MWPFTVGRSTAVMIRKAYLTDIDHRENDAARLVRAVLRLARWLRRSTPEGEITGSGLALLGSLHRQGSMSAVALAGSEGLQPQSLSRLRVRLESDGLIERPIDPSDRRRQMIALTRAGLVALHRAMTRRRAWLTDAMTRELDDADRRTLLAASEVMLKLASAAQEDDRKAD